MSIQLFPRANEGRELLIQINANCDENAIQNHKANELRKVFEDFQQTFKKFNDAWLHIGEGVIQYNFLMHETFVGKEGLHEEKVNHQEIAQDFFKNRITKLANDIAAIDDPQHKKNAAIIEECLREILFKASGAKTKEEFENIHAAAYCDAAKVLNAKMVKLLMGDLKTQAQKDKPEYKAEKENKKRNAQILALNNEIQQLENELKNLPPINFKDERMEKHFNAGFVATIEETIGFLNNKLKYQSREVVKNATEQALNCLNQIKDAVEKGESLELDLSAIDGNTVLLKQPIKEFFSEEINGNLNAIKEKVPDLIEQGKRGDKLKKLIEEKKQQLVLLENPQNENPPVQNPSPYYPFRTLTTRKEEIKEEPVFEKKPDPVLKIEEKKASELKVPQEKVPQPPQEQLKKEPIVEVVKAAPQPTVEQPKVERKPGYSSRQTGTVKQEQKSAVEEKPAVEPVIEKPKIEQKQPVEDKKVPLYKKILKGFLKPFIWFGSVLKRFFDFLTRNDE